MNALGWRIASSDHDLPRPRHLQAGVRVVLREQGAQGLTVSETGAETSHHAIRFLSDRKGVSWVLGDSDLKAEFLNGHLQG